MRTILRVLIVCVFLPAVAAVADERPFNAFNKTAYGYLKDTILRSAEKMPEESYGFKPTEAVRSYGEILGHVAGSQYFFCAKVLGDKSAPKVDETKTSKADRIAVLKAAFAYCDKAYDTITPASATQMVKFHGADLSLVDVLSANNMHTVEHYGNLITYMRMKNIVPPSSETPVVPPAKK